jgi:curli biogenesis system outer membrane secretion channel CsgG
MKRISSIIFLFIAIMMMNNCGTSTKVKVLKPAELDVGAVRKIAVMDFDFRGSWDFGLGKKVSGGLRGLGQALLRKALKQQDKLDPVAAYPGSDVSDMFVAKLVNNKFYTVIEREEISKILEEQALGLSGVIDETTAAEIGKLLGAEGLVMGSGTYSVTDKGEWETYKVKKVEKKRFRISRHVDVKLTFKVVNVTTGSIIASATNTQSNGSGKRVSSNASSTGKNESEALRNVPDWRPIVDGLVNKILNKTIQQLAPHYVTESREIEEGESSVMEAAVEYAKRGLWEDARDLFGSVLEDPTADKDDHIAATYNIGLYYEINGQLDEAEAYFDKSFKMSGDSKFLDARARIQKRRKEIQRLEEQQM